MKRIFIFVMFISVLGSWFSVLAEHQAPSTEQRASHSEEKHSESETHGVSESASESHTEHEQEPPFVYYLNWIGLILIGLIVSRGFKDIYQKKKEQANGDKIGEFYVAGHIKPHDLEHKESRPIIREVLVVILVCIVFGIEQLPAIFGYIDVANATFVPGFHENLTAGYFRLLFKIAIGILILSYSLLGREEHH